MKVAIVQFDIEWAKPLDNINKVEKLVAQNPKADLYVLPEMWSTGFISTPQTMAENEQTSVSLDWMKSFTRDNKCAICGSLAIKTADSIFYNRNYFITSETIQYYDKRHLFTHGGEHRSFSAGQSHTIVEWNGFRILLLTCYDLRFPVWSRYGISGAYDAIIYVANWPTSRQQAWDLLTKARAIENQCYVIAANRVGKDPNCSYCGGSVIIDPLGNELAKSNAECLVEKTLCIDELNKMRAKFKVLDDRDKFVDCISV